MSAAGMKSAGAWADGTRLGDAGVDREAETVAVAEPGVHEPRADRRAHPGRVRGRDGVDARHEDDAVAACRGRPGAGRVARAAEEERHLRGRGARLADATDRLDRSLVDVALEAGDGYEEREEPH